MTKEKTGMDKIKAIEAAWKAAEVWDIGRLLPTVQFFEQSLLASGFAIVPVEPTDDMIKASHHALYHWREKVAKDPQQDASWEEKHAIRYRAMIRASPQKVAPK